MNLLTEGFCVFPHEFSRHAPRTFLDSGYMTAFVVFSFAANWFLVKPAASRDFLSDTPNSPIPTISSIVFVLMLIVISRLQKIDPAVAD